MAYGMQPTGGAARDRITQALMNIQNPPPVTQMPQMPQMGGPAPGGAPPQVSGATAPQMPPPQVPTAPGAPMAATGAPLPQMAAGASAPVAQQPQQLAPQPGAAPRY